MTAKGHREGVAPNPMAPGRGQICRLESQPESDGAGRSARIEDEDPDRLLVSLDGPNARPSAGGHHAMAAFLEAGVPFDGVLATSDVVAFGAIGALREAGIRVPEDISVVGFGDIPLAAYCDPPLTTIHVPAYDVGLVAGRVLIDTIERRPVEPLLRLPTSLVVRASTAPAAGFRQVPAERLLTAS